MSAITIPTPADVTRRAKPLQQARRKTVLSTEDRAKAKQAAALRWAQNEKLRRTLEGQLQGCDGRFAGKLRQRLSNVKRLLRQDAWAAPKQS